MSEDFGLREYLDAKFAEVHEKFQTVYDKQDITNGRVNKIESEHREMIGGLKVAKWIGGLLGLPGLVAFFKMFIVPK